MIFKYVCQKPYKQERISLIANTIMNKFDIHIMSTPNITVMCAAILA